MSNPLDNITISKTENNNYIAKTRDYNFIAQGDKITKALETLFLSVHVMSEYNKKHGIPGFENMKKEEELSNKIISEMLFGLREFFKIDDNTISTVSNLFKHEDGMWFRFNEYVIYRGLLPSLWFNLVIGGELFIDDWKYARIGDDND